MRSLTWKLSLAFLSVSLTGALVAGVFIHLATQRSFGNLVLNRAETQFVAQMAGYYQAHGNWNGVYDYAAHSPDFGGQQHGSAFVLLDQQGVVLTECQNYQVGAVVPLADRTGGMAVVVNSQTVGTVLADGATPPLSPQEVKFLAATNAALLLGSLAAIVIALALGLILARSLTRPVRDLTGALRAMGAGAIQQTVPVYSNDEIGALSVAFNHMSADLARANAQRRQMTADIAHDLRTPVTVLVGYLEAMRDGVLLPTPERFTILHDEARHLQHLIEDLRTLSLADAGELTLNRAPIAPGALLRRLADLYSHQAEQRGVQLRVAAPDDAPAIDGDEERLVQVLSNLVSNALRYTPAGGEIALLAERRAGGVALLVRDTGQGIQPADLARIFDRFYRADAARTQSQGESGLGLAIARAIVEAHHGTISVASAVGAGTTFTILLPDVKNSATSRR